MLCYVPCYCSLELILRCMRVGGRAGWVQRIWADSGSTAIQRDDWLVGGANIDVTVLFCLRDESEHYAKGLRQTALKAGKRHTMYITDTHRHAHTYI